ncbi:hypothetical protein Pint_12295 [Pistacia integerrima]|uniref:Uncharacterized protein n=1 Tax=Pistacia integerrima TaxID=434235 RepID=A0ACC0XDZ8_9ROSI|nr:hypothetical protein Pint_12295 [Pistacia integerrima]
MKDKINITAKLSNEGDTALHIAAAARRTDFVKKLLQYMNKEDLSIKNNAGNTAFFVAVSSGEVDIVKALKEKNEDLVKNREKDMMEKNEDLINNEVKRRVINSVLGKKNVPKSFRDRLNDREQQRRNKMHWTDRTKKAKWKVNFRGEEIPDSAFELVECLWKEVMHLDDSQILKIIIKPWSLIFEATKQGNLRFIDIIFHEYPDLMFEVDKNNYTIFHYTVMYRHYNIFKIIYTIGPLKNLVVKKTDKKGNNILHLAAKLPEQDTPGAESTATHFKMSTEMRWFKVNIN